MSKNHVQSNNQNEQSKIIAHQQTISITSPFPPPAVLEAMERLVPGSAKEVLDISIKSIEVQNEIQKRSLEAAIEHEHRAHTTIRWTVIPVIVGGFVLALLKGDLPSYGILIGSLATLIGSFYYSKKIEQRDN